MGPLGPIIGIVNRLVEGGLVAYVPCPLMVGPPLVTIPPSPKMLGGKKGDIDMTPRPSKKMMERKMWYVWLCAKCYNFVSNFQRRVDFEKKGGYTQIPADNDRWRPRCECCKERRELNVIGWTRSPSMYSFPYGKAEHLWQQQKAVAQHGEKMRKIPEKDQVDKESTDEVKTHYFPGEKKRIRLGDKSNWHKQKDPNDPKGKKHIFIPPWDRRHPKWRYNQVASRKVKNQWTGKQDNLFMRWCNDEEDARQCAEYLNEEYKGDKARFGPGTPYHNAIWGLTEKEPVGEDTYSGVEFGETEIVFHNGAYLPGEEE